MRPRGRRREGLRPNVLGVGGRGRITEGRISSASQGGIGMGGGRGAIYLGVRLGEGEGAI